MPLDGITLHSVVRELSGKLIGGRADKVSQPEADEIMIAVRSQGQNHKLLLCANANSPRIHLTQITKPSPAQAPMFCMLLRKHLSGGRLIKICQPDFERIVEIYVESPNEMGDLSVKRLIIEIMGKHSNIMLIDADDRIMGAIRHVSRELSSVREIFPGREYISPPSQGKMPPVPINNIFFISLFTSPKNKGKRIQQVIYQSYNGISPIMASEICLRANILPDTFCEEVSEDELSQLLTAFTNLYNDMEAGKFECYIYSGQKRDFSATLLSVYPEKSEPFDSPSEMVESYYLRQDTHYRLAQKTQDLRKLIQNHLERCHRKDQIHQTSIKEIEDREQLRKYGELITAYIYAIPAGSDRAKVLDFYDTTESSTEGGSAEIEIPLDPTLTPSENAQRYFKQYNKAKRTALALEEQMATNTDDIAYLDSVLSSIESAMDESDIADIRTELAEQGFLKKRSNRGGQNNTGQNKNGKNNKDQKKNHRPEMKKSKPLRYRSSEGFDIYVGKNNTQNDELTLRFALPGDIWLHTKEIAGSHVIIRGENREIPETTITEGAMIAAYYSKGRQGSQVPVDFCPRKNVRKPKGAKPGFVIYDFYNTLYVTPSEDEIEKLKEKAVKDS